MALQAHLKFDETIGATSYVDATGNGNTGTPAGNAVLIPSAITADTSGNALKNPGASGDYVSLAGPNITGTAFSIALWARILNGSSGDFIIRAAGSTYQYHFNISSIPFTRLGLRCMTVTANSNNLSIGIDTGWHHFAATWDGTNARFFYDGVFINSAALSTTLTSVASATTRIATLTPVSATYSNLEIDGLRIYDDTQSDGNITSIFTSELPNYDETAMPIIAPASTIISKPVIVYPYPGQYRTDMSGSGGGSSRPSSGQMFPRGN